MRRQDKQLVIENAEIYQYYKERLINMALAQFEWHGLPDTCDRLYFERRMLFDGTAAMFKPTGTDFWVTAGYVQKTGINGQAFDIYGYPTAILGVGYNAVNIETDEWMILFDNMTKTVVTKLYGPDYVLTDEVKIFLLDVIIKELTRVKEAQEQDEEM